MYKELPHKEKPDKGYDKFNSRRTSRFSHNEEKIKNGSIQIELSQASVPEDGTAYRRTKPA